MINFETKITKSGTGKAILIPSSIVKQEGFKKGDRVSVEIKKLFSYSDLVEHRKIKTWYCQNCDYDFPSQDDDDDVYCPICGETGEFIVEVGEEENNTNVKELEKLESLEELEK